MDLHGYQRLLIFGGSFDPPHRAHVELPRLVRQRIGADVVVYVPAGRSPHKPDQAQSSAAHRLAMTRLAVADDPRSVVLPVEIDRGSDEPSYTVQTLEWLNDRTDPGLEMRLLIGADQALAFDRWYQPHRIMELAEPIVMLRPPDDAEQFLSQMQDSANRQYWADRLIELPAIPVSASQIRKRIATGQSISDLVRASVARYIGEHRIYA